VNPTVVRLGTAIPLLWLSALAAGPPKQVPSAPVPAQMLTAKKVFVVNAGADRGTFSGDSERSYDGFYAAMKTWGHYQLVGAPSDADLLIEIRFTVRPGLVQDGRTMYSDAQFRVVIRDPKTQTMLWAITEPVAKALMQENLEKNFDQALARTVADLQRLTAPSTLGGSSSQ
jgi:hypothetical protein